MINPFVKFKINIFILNEKDKKVKLIIKQDKHVIKKWRKMSRGVAQSWRYSLLLQSRWDFVRSRVQSKAVQALIAL